MPPLVGNLSGKGNDSSAQSLALSDNDLRGNRQRASHHRSNPFDSSKSRDEVDASASADVVSAKARQLGIDVVECSHSRNLYSPSFPLVDVLLHDDVSIIMRKIVKKTILEKQPLFEGMIQSVRPVDIEDFKLILTNVICHLVNTSSAANNATTSSNLTWGRIVAAYAFGGLFANDALAQAVAIPVASSSSSSTSVGANSTCSSISSAGSKSTSSEVPHLDAKELGAIVGDVIDEVAGSWIQEQGGWNSFANHFGTVNHEESLARNLIYLVGASAAAAFGIACLKSMLN